MKIWQTTFLEFIVSHQIFHTSNPALAGDWGLIKGITISDTSSFHPNPKIYQTENQFTTKYLEKISPLALPVPQTILLLPPLTKEVRAVPYK